jgi:two-component system chemotaxis response regulator CheB
MPPPAIVVIGASAGGVAPLLDLVAALPTDLPAPVCVALHVGVRASILPELLRRRGSLPANHARHGEPLRPAQIYVAPPDHHLLVNPHTVQLSRGPREHHARPAIDPLFRTAALHWRERAVGVVLSGALDDGCAGQAAIKACGGTVVVQDPATAFDPSMPRSVLSNVSVDHCVGPKALGPLLAQLVGQARAPGIVPDQLRQEQAASEGTAALNHLDRIGKPSTLTCPECGGGLWEINDARPLRFRCHTGHAYSVRSLDDAQKDASEQAGQAQIRLLQEREMLLRRMAEVAQAIGDPAQAAVGRREADRLRDQVQRLQSALQEESPGA